MEAVKRKFFTNELKTKIGYVIFGFLLGVAPLAVNLMPFGCALLCAMPQKGRREVFFGALAAAFFDECIILSLFCVVYLFLILNAKEKQGGVYLYVRLLLSVSISALRGAYIALTGVNDMAGVFCLLAAIIAYPAFTYAFSGYFDKRKEIRPKRYDMALLAFAFAFTLVLSNYKLFGVSLAIIPATAFTLSAARTRGFAFGGVCGVVCGLVSGGAATGALGVLGMSYGLLVNEVEILALILSFMLAVTGYFYLSGTEGVIPAAVLMLIVYAGFLPLRSRLPIYRHKVSSAEKRAYDRKLSRYAATFSSLSSLFYTVSDNAKQESITDVNQKIVAAVDSFCCRCEGCELDKSEISNFFTSEYRRSGVTTYSKIPLHISSKCPNACAMARVINNFPNQKERQSEKGLIKMAEEYSAFSTVLIDAAKKQEDLNKSDKELAERIRKNLLEIGVACDGVKVVGARIFNVTAFGVVPDKITKSPNEISDSVSSVLKTKMSSPEFLMHDDYVLMKMHSIPAFRVECAKISEAKTGESVCGDTVSVFENEEKYSYCLVSDGMGSGRDAALTSRLAAIMLEKLLTVGAEKESALKMLNKALVEKQEEVFATVDLLEIDRIRSSATLIKAGAAPTILIRGGKAQIIEARTPPAGIMKKVIADKKTFRLEKGDMLVMLSDGILQTGNEYPLFTEKPLPPMPSARALAGKIMRDARQNAETADDMSVCVLRIV